MKIGKVSESILKRSVLRNCGTKREEVIIGAGLGKDCAVLQFQNDKEIVMTTNSITGAYRDCGRYAVHRAMNNLAASGAEPVGVLLSVLLPAESEEILLKEIMAQVSAECKALQIEIMGGHTEVTDAVKRVLLTVTGIGKVTKGKNIHAGGARPGQDIVISKWVAIEGSSILAKEKKEELEKRYSKHFIKEAEALNRYLSVLPEAKIAASLGVSAMHDLSEGGIFGALWDMAVSSGVGLEVNLKQIPIRQESVELCNFYDINPYEFQSLGSLLMVTDNGEDLVNQLNEAGIPAAIIGRTTDGNDKLIRNEEEVRYLEPARQDERHKISFERFE